MELQTNRVKLTGYRNRERMNNVACANTKSLGPKKSYGAENFAFDDNEINRDLNYNTSDSPGDFALCDPETGQVINHNASSHADCATFTGASAKPDKNDESANSRNCSDDILYDTNSGENVDFETSAGYKVCADKLRETKLEADGAADNTVLEESDLRHDKRPEWIMNPRNDDFEDAGGGFHLNIGQDGDSSIGCSDHDATRSVDPAEDKPSPKTSPVTAKKQKKNVQKWIVLAAAFLCRILGEGYANSMGIFFLEFLEYFDSGRGVTGWTVSIATGIMYGAGIPISFLVHKTNERGCCIAGGLIAGSGLIASYFATNVYILLGTFGVMTGIGLAFIQISYVIAVGRHFREGRGPATAICETGVTVGGIAFPPLLRFLTDNYEWRGALLISGGILLNIVAFGILFSPPSTPTPDNLTGDRDEDIVPTNLNDPVKYCNSDIKRVKPFVVYVIVGMVVGLSSFFPYGTIVDIANIRNYEKQKSTYLVMALSVANTVGVFIMAGLLKLFWRRVTLLYTLNICLLGASLYVFPLTGTYETLLLATVLYGVPVGGLYGCYAVVVVDLLGEKLYTPGLGFTCSGYGIGFALSTPVAGWITEATGDYDKPFYINGSVCLGAAGLFGAALLVEKCQKRMGSHRPPQAANTDVHAPR